MTQQQILIAPASFKGSLSAIEAAEVMRAFLKERVHPKTVLLQVCPIADGGDDTLAVLQMAKGEYRQYTHPVTGPLPGLTVQANYLVDLTNKTVWIEAAQAHGLKLLPAGIPLEALQATSYGVGELIRHVVRQHQPETLVVSLGGSASTDGGQGALQALGFQCLDESGQAIPHPVGGGDLIRISRIVWPEDNADFGWRQLLIATDVVNPLLGEDGAAMVFGPQKGATPSQCRQLDNGLSHLSSLMASLPQGENKRKDAAPPSQDLATLPGAGAAGGLAYGLRCLPRSGIVSGSQWIAEQLNLPHQVAESQIILTGEGCLDLTSLGGKATGHLLAMAGEKPVLFFCGQARDGLTGWGQVRVYPMVGNEDGLQADSALENHSSTSNPQAEDAKTHHMKAIEAAMADPKAALQRLLAQAWPTLERLISEG
jgi:glycerate kinase